MLVQKKLWHINLLRLPKGLVLLMPRRQVTNFNKDQTLDLLAFIILPCYMWYYLLKFEEWQTCCWELISEMIHPNG